jgi:carboxylesterase type B
MLIVSYSRFDHSTVYEGGDGADGQVIDASDYGPACPQHEAVSFAAPDDLGLGSVLSLLEGTPLLAGVLKQSEDCLSINVQRPQNDSLTDLPVVVWM